MVEQLAKYKKTKTKRKEECMKVLEYFHMIECNIAIWYQRIRKQRSELTKK